MADDGPTTTAVPKPKRSLFSKPAFVTTSVTSSDAESGDIFSRSNQSYAEIRAEQERKRRLKLARAQKEADRQADSPSREGKRRRISQDEEDVGNRDNELEPKHTAHVGRGDTPIEKRASKESQSLPARSPLNSLSKRYEDVVTASKPSKPEAVIIDLEDSDADDPHNPSRRNYNQEPANETDVVKPGASELGKEPNSDDEFAELAARARERRRLREQQAKATPPLASNSFTSGSPLATPPISPPDPIIQILLTSRIANTKPLIVHRRLSQRLQEIRTAWCQKQGFTPEMTASVFLTWRNRRLVDVMTCKSLGISVDDEGKPVMDGANNGLTEDGTRLHIEAVTQDIFEENKRMAERKLHAEEPEEEELEEEEVQEKPAKEDHQYTRVVLKAKGYEDHKLKVNPDTTFGRMIWAFRQSRRVPEDKEVFLMFDGERLDPDTMVQGSDIADMDTIEVHIR